MILVKANNEKGRRVFYKDGKYIKIWYNVKPQWIVEHVRLLRHFVSYDYVHEYGGNWISFNEIEGTPASKLEHTDSFIKQIYQYCLDNIEETKPYVHGDWVLSNIIVCPDNTFKLIDWDNIGIYSENEYMNKLHSDLRSSFGERFNDAAGI